MMRLAIAIGVLVLICGCGRLPQVLQQPEIHNRFPQLTKIAVPLFFNLTSEPTVDGLQFGQLFFEALRSIPGFEVVPMGAVENAAKPHGIQVLCCGLPWGTTEEEYIPPSLNLEAETALARAQLATQTPQLPDPTVIPPPQGSRPKSALALPAFAAAPAAVLKQPNRTNDYNRSEPNRQSAARKSQRAVAASNNAIDSESAPCVLASNAATATPPDRPDPRGFIPPLPSSQRPRFVPS